MLSLRSRYDEHLSRKVFHILAGTAVCFAYVNVFSRLQSIAILGLIGIFLLVLDLLRLRIPALNRAVLSVYGPLMRDNEREGPSAQLYYVLGLFWAVFVLPRAVGVQAILTLAWMDPLAALFGVRFGRTSWSQILRDRAPVLGRKTIEGSLAGFLAAFLAGIWAWTGPWASVLTSHGYRWPGPWEIATMASIGGVTAVLAEALPSQWDDNATIPFWVGLVVWVVASFLGLPMNFV